MARQARVRRMNGSPGQQDVRGASYYLRADRGDRNRNAAGFARQPSGAERGERFVDKLQPLGDQAALAYFADEASALHFAAAVRRAGDPWLVDVVQAYTSVAVFFDLDRVH